MSQPSWYTADGDAPPEVSEDSASLLEQAESSGPAAPTTVRPAPSVAARPRKVRRDMGSAMVRSCREVRGGGAGCGGFVLEEVDQQSPVGEAQPIGGDVDLLAEVEGEAVVPVALERPDVLLEDLLLHPERL